MILKLGIVQINVTNLVEAKKFYAEILGFKIDEKFGFDAPFILESPGGPTLLVHPADTLVHQRYPDHTGTILVFYTEDIVATVADWKAKGVVFIPVKGAPEDTGIADTPFGPYTAFSDPFGNVHELLQPK